MEPTNPEDDPRVVVDEFPSLEKVHRRYSTGLEHIRAQLKRVDVNSQESKAKLMQALARPENIGLEVTDSAYKFIDACEAYELTLLLIKEYLEGYLNSTEENAEIATFRETSEKSIGKLQREIDRLRKQNNLLYQQYRMSQDELVKFVPKDELPPKDDELETEEIAFEKRP